MSRAECRLQTASASPIRHALSRRACPAQVAPIPDDRPHAPRRQSRRPPKATAGASHHATFLRPSLARPERRETASVPCSGTRDDPDERIPIHPVRRRGPAKTLVGIHDVTSSWQRRSSATFPEGGSGTFNLHDGAARDPCAAVRRPRRRSARGRDAGGGGGAGDGVSTTGPLFPIWQGGLAGLGWTPRRLGGGRRGSRHVWPKACSPRVGGVPCLGGALPRGCLA